MFFSEGQIYLFVEGQVYLPIGPIGRIAADQMNPADRLSPPESEDKG